MKVAIQGERGSFSHEAALRLVPGCSVIPCTTSIEVFERVASGAVASAVVPIENSLAGPVAEHYDLLLTHNLSIRCESQLRIAHNLIAGGGVALKDVREVFSHPVALAQCRDFFRRHPRVRPMPFYDTAGAVRHVVAEKLPDAAAIAGRNAAAEYGGKILRTGLEDDKHNYTRFFLLAKRPRVASNANKTSVAFALKNVPGALFRALSVFALRDIDLSRIESRPIRGRPWEYVFYVDFRRGRDPAADNALRHLAEIAEFVKVLGIYRAA